MTGQEPREWEIKRVKIQIGDSNCYEGHQIAEGELIKENEAVTVIEAAPVHARIARLEKALEYCKKKYEGTIYMKLHNPQVMDRLNKEIELILKEKK